MKTKFVVLTLSGFMSIGLLARAEEKTEKVDALRDFTAGDYALSEGEEKFCGDGNFYVTPDGSRVWLGPYYSFRTTPGVMTDKGGLNVDKGCTYKSEAQVQHKGRETILTDISTQQCGDVKRQVVTNQATIEKHKIKLQQTSQADPKNYDHAGGTPHECAWSLKK